MRTSVIALIPPTLGIRASLTCSGLSRVVIGGDIFQTEVIRRAPETVSLTSPSNATGVFELDPNPEMLLPFEGMGVDTTWEFRMPKPANAFDYTTIADVLVTVEYTALDSYDYRQQVLQTLPDTDGGDRAFSLRFDFPDAWYDLNNPEQASIPMTVAIQIRREDFQVNLDNPNPDLTVVVLHDISH